MFMSEKDFNKLLKEAKDANGNVDTTFLKRQLLRFYGGYSTIPEASNFDTQKLIKELLSHLKQIRNDNFHFTTSKQSEVDVTYTTKLWENELFIYQKVIKDSYYNNNVARFYDKATIKELVQKLYGVERYGVAQIPAFRTVWPKAQLAKYMDEQTFAWERGSAIDVIYENAIFFLLKEIYYRDFVQSDVVAKYFFDAVDAYDKEQNDNLTIAQDEQMKAQAEGRSYYADFKELKNLVSSSGSFKRYVDILKAKHDNNELSFGGVCQLINEEYNQQNRNNKAGEIYKHFKVLLPLCMRNGYERYLKENYAFLTSPMEFPKDMEEYLADVKISCIEMKMEYAQWFTFAHFLHPRQLHILVGNFKDYIQYREDVLRRARYAGQLTDEKFGKEKEALDISLERAKSILIILQFVRNISGRVSIEFTDYYQDKEAYAKYLSNYIEFDTTKEETVFDSFRYFCMNTLENGVNMDIYTDTYNARIIRNVEIARMYAGGDVGLAQYDKITAEEIQTFYDEKPDVAGILSTKRSRDEDEKRRFVDFQKLKERITLNEITELFSLVNDMLGQLVSLSYLRERDEMYLFLGFYYMALRNPEGWKNEVLDSLDEDGYKVAKGLVLYQTVALFDYDTKLLCKYAETKKDSNGVEYKAPEAWCERTGRKWNRFIENHRESYQCILPLFENPEYSDDASNVVLVDEEYAKKHRMKKYTRCRENTYKCMDENVEVKLKLGARSDTFMKGMFALFNRSK